MIKRTLYDALKSHLSHKEISFIIGPRQAGKTTLMLLLKAYLEKKGNRTLFLNLDVEADKQFFTSQDKLLRKIQLELGKDQGFVFIDEIQRKENAGIFLKGLYDMNLPYKFIVSGSGSVELKEKIHESLVGRKRIFELSTLSFVEFVNFKTDYKYEHKLLELFNIDKAKTNQFLEEYMSFGGYPRLVLDESLDEKRRLMDEVYQSYLERDISYLLRIKKMDAFSNLIKVLATQIGNLVNYSELSSILGLSISTLKEYLWFLEKTFIVLRITPYFKNIRKEIRKSPMFYFYDLGLRNYSLGRFGTITDRRDKGFLFQNFVFNILREQIIRTSAKVHFWRTKDKAEVDFVINTGSVLIPLEVKYKELKKSEITRSLRSFIEKYDPGRAFIINLELKEDLIINTTKVHFLPFYEIYQINLSPKS